MSSSARYKQFVEDNLGEIPQFIIYAVLEMGIIGLLYLEAFFAYISYEFAKFFDLQIPCLLCTRIEHVLLNKDTHYFHNELICESHKKAVSALAYCHFHRKISDIKNMCEGCLLSFSTDRDSDTDNPKPLVGIIQKDIHGFVEEDHKNLLKGNDAKLAEQGSINRCACCGEPLTNKNSKKMARNASMKAVTILSNAPASPRPPIGTMKTEEGRNLELPLSRFAEIKLSPHAEPELPEDVTGMTPIAGMNPGQQQIKDLKAETVPLLPDAEDIPEDILRTPTTSKANKFFGIPLTDATQAAGTPKWANRLAKKVQLEKDFFAEPSDLNPTNESESEALIRLRKQVRSDRKSLYELSMELDEERSASAIAANNAMAMITRLQAEKAAVQMEALQYQRMMEEQAEYDQEAVQIMKDILVKREGEIKILEAELETYKEKYGELKKAGSVECEVDGEEDYQDMKSQSVSSFGGEKSECGSPNGHHGEHEHTVHTAERSREIGGGTEEASFDFEGEKSYLLGMLTNLEKKIQLASDEGTGSSSDVPDIAKKEDKEIENKAILNREMSLFRERLRAIEADSGFLKHAAMTLQRGSEGTKLLTQIAQHLEKLRQAENLERTDTDAEKTEKEKAEKRMDTDAEKTEKRMDMDAENPEKRTETHTDAEKSDKRMDTDAEKTEKRTDTDALSS